MSKYIYMLYMWLHNFLYTIKPIRRVYYFFKIDPVNRKRSKALVKDGADNLKMVIDALHGADIQAFCAYGTLLGIVRDGNLIPYDTDMDMAVMEQESFSWDTMKKALESYGLKLVRYYTYEGKITEQCYSFPDGLQIDFFLFQKENSHTCSSYYYFRDHSMIYKNSRDLSVKINRYPMISGVTEMDFHGMRVPVPEHPEKHLEDVYGSSWKTPDPNFHPDETVNRMPELGQMIRV